MTYFSWCNCSLTLSLESPLLIPSLQFEKSFEYGPLKKFIKTKCPCFWNNVQFLLASWHVHFKIIQWSIIYTRFLHWLYIQCNFVQYVDRQIYNINEFICEQGWWFTIPVVTSEERWLSWGLFWAHKVQTYQVSTKATSLLYDWLIVVVRPIENNLISYTKKIMSIWWRIYS